MGRIVSASGQIFRYDFRPQDEIFRPKMTIRPSDEQALSIETFMIEASKLNEMLENLLLHSFSLIRASSYKGN